MYHTSIIFAPCFTPTIYSRTYVRYTVRCITLQSLHYICDGLQTTDSGSCNRPRNRIINRTNVQRMWKVGMYKKRDSAHSILLHVQFFMTHFITLSTHTNIPTFADNCNIYSWLLLTIIYDMCICSKVLPYSVVMTFR